MLLTDLSVATMSGDAPYGLIADAAIAVDDGAIVWVGPADTVPAEHRALEQIALGGRLVTPGLIDCHTHLVFGGDRAGEFEMRLNGASYDEVARAGGGIVSTVRDTRAASEDDLVASALPRLDALLAEGVTTVEIKSGYGLDRETEARMLRAARRLGEARAVDVVTTYLGAHALPPEYAGQADAYLADVVLPALPDMAGLADHVDAFCEGIAFSPAELEPGFAEARRLGFGLKIHAEQLSNLGGAQMAARHGALSADHLEYATDDDARAMAASGTTAVILPGAFYTIHETQAPPIQAFRDHGVPMAVATDCNPGSSPMTSILLAMNMVCTLFRMTPEEALAGATRNAARALGLGDRGVIAPGMRADLAVWKIEKPAELSYRMGFNPLHQRWVQGVLQNGVLQ
ncbi:MAG: imidazolonepropionase [Pseudomonadota bacterium]